MYVIHTDASGRRERIYLDPDSNSPVYQMLSIGNTVKIEVYSRSGLRHTYERCA